MQQIIHIIIIHVRNCANAHMSASQLYKTYYFSQAIDWHVIIEAVFKLKVMV